MTRFLIIPFIFFSFQLADGKPPHFIVWNVGQGQWATFVTGHTCYHFDTGGEINPIYKVRRSCMQRQHRIYFSHWDWDHINFVRSLSKHLKKPCIEALPGGPANTYKKSLIEKLPLCGNQIKSLVSELSGDQEIAQKTSNEHSRVFLAANRILIPGDSPTAKEKTWLKQLPNTHGFILLLGHHGSKTSTSMPLLERLVPMRIAIASARKKRYGHPHFETLMRLKIKKAPVLTTEDWGSILLEL